MPTMLDGMRRHKGWLKWSLGIVIIAFVVLYVPSFLKPGDSGANASDTIATVNGRKVLVGTYQRLYNQQVQQLRSAYAGQFDEQMLKQLGIAQRVVQQLVDQQATLAEADRLGITVTDAELRERLVRIPGFQEGGQFIGHARYVQLLQMQRPPIRSDEFEAQLRDELIVEKLQAAVTAWLRVSDEEINQELHKRNEKVKLDLAIFTANQFRSGVQTTDAEIAAQFAAHGDLYKIPEKRHVRYLAIEPDMLKAKMTVTPQELQAKYTAMQQTYSTPEQIRASHILFKTEGKDEAAVKAVAETVLKKVKAGGDFAALAKQYSEDDSKTKGGDLDYFGHGTMVKEFDDAAWALKIGETSDLVKSQFGFHIIKLTDKKAATNKTMEEVRPQIDDMVRGEKAQAEASKLSEEIAKQIKDPADLDKVAKERGFSIGDSGLFSREEPLAGLGFAPSITNEAFTMEQGKVSGLLRTNQGFAFIVLTEVKPSYAPKLEEVKEKVKDDVVRQKAVELAKTKAAAMAQSAKSNFAAAAKAAGVEVKTTDFIARGSALPEVGVNGAIDNAVFGLKAGETTAPISTDTAVVVAHVKEKQDVDPAKADTDRTSLRSELIQQRRNEFFAAYMAKARGKLTYSYNENAIKTLMGGS